MAINFDEFKQVNKAEWLQKVETDLKGKPLATLDHEISKGIVMSPFAASEDTPKLDTAVLKTANPDWQVGETIVVKNPAEANKQMLDALMNGVNAPCFRLTSPLTSEELGTLMQDIGVEFVACHFEFDYAVDGRAFFNLWQNLLKTRGLDSTFAAFEFKDSTDSLAVVVQLNTDYSCETVHFDCRQFAPVEDDAVLELQQALALAKNRIADLVEAGCTATQIFQQSFFTLTIGNNHLLEIAKIRALKLLWIELGKSFGLDQVDLPFIKVNFKPGAYGISKHDNLINASNLAMSAASGGASMLVVDPRFEPNTSPNTTDYRLARNIQLILKHESGFDQVADPAAGSYYLEKLTAKLVEGATQNA